MPNHVEINSLAQLMMIFRAMRPLRIYTLVPHIRRVVVELCKGFKEILLVRNLLFFPILYKIKGIERSSGTLLQVTQISPVESKDSPTFLFF